MRVQPVLLAVLFSALSSGEARACKCAQGVIDRLYQSPAASQRAVLLRVKGRQSRPASAASEETGAGWVELETHALRGGAFERFRTRGTSCDLRVPPGGWFLLLTAGDPERGFSMCDSALIALEEAGPYLAHLVPNPAWTACRTDADCTASVTPGCLPPLPVRPDSLRPVAAWRQEVAQALQCGAAKAAPASAPALRTQCQSGTCGFAPPPEN